VVEDLKKRSKKIKSSEEVGQVGTISANGEKAIGDMIAKAAAWTSKSNATSRNTKPRWKYRGFLLVQFVTWMSAAGPSATWRGTRTKAASNPEADRGLLSLANDLTILKSWHLNHDVSHLINKDLKAHVPREMRLQPHSIYLSWQRQSVFKG
jgi:hypothetical protein